MKSKINTIKKFITYLIKISKRKSIVIAAPYFNKERLKDGYYKRVKAVDELLSNYYKVYITYETTDHSLVYEEANDNTLVIRYLPSSKMHKFLISLIILQVGKVYCHSVWQAKKSFYRIPFVKVYVDVHGVVPEEETLYGRYNDAQMYGDIEEIVVRKSEYLICVTNKIEEHLRNKYPYDFKAKTICLPIFDKSLEQEDTKTKNKKTIDNKYVFTYAGGTMLWQKIPMMQDAIFAQMDSAIYKICVPKPEEYWDTWKYSKDQKNMTVESKNYKDLCEEVYSISHYGFALRDDIVVNNVACPTKIAEYLKYDIIPILNTPNIGDFMSLGMKYLSLEDFKKGNFYSEKERKEVVKANRIAFNNYLKLHENGIKKFKGIFK